MNGLILHTRILRSIEYERNRWRALAICLLIALAVAVVGVWVK